MRNSNRPVNSGSLSAFSLGVPRSGNNTPTSAIGSGGAGSNIIQFNAKTIRSGHAYGYGNSDSEDGEGFFFFALARVMRLQFTIMIDPDEEYYEDDFGPSYGDE